MVTIQTEFEKSYILEQLERYPVTDKEDSVVHEDAQETENDKQELEQLQKKYEALQKKFAEYKEYAEAEIKRLKLEPKENVDINKAYLIEKKKHDALLNYVLLLANDTA